MVDVLMLDSLGNTDPARLLDVGYEYERSQTPGLEQSFFSRRSIYEASAYSQIDESGNETDFLGHVIVQSDGDLGFDPSAVLAGEVGGMGIRDFLATEIGSHRSGSKIWSDLLDGDDVVLGNGHVSRISGYRGDDILSNVAVLPADGVNVFLKGNGGDDVLFSHATYTLSGGGGADRFVVDSRQSWYILDFAHGTDHVLLDGPTFPEVGAEITEASFRVGPRAIDADDRLIVNFTSKNQLTVYVDPDGSGPEAQVRIGAIHTRVQLTFDSASSTRAR